MEHRKLGYLKHYTLFFLLGLSWLWFISLIHPAHAVQPAPPLQGPLLATNTQNQDGFLLIDMATGQRRRLAFGTGDHYIGGFSPDGCQLVFTWEAELGKAHLYLANLDGSGLRQLTEVRASGAQSFIMWEPSWSPDGSRIVFTYMRYYTPPNEPPTRTSHIAWVSPVGGAPNLYSNSGAEFQPRWSPDGTWIVYVSKQPLPDAEEAEGETPPKKSELWLMRADGTDKRRFTSFGVGNVYNPQWSQSGDLIAFVYEVAANSHQLKIMSLDGGLGIHTVNPQSAMILDYVWHTTGRDFIVAMRGFGGENQNTLWQMSASQNPPPAKRLFEDFAYDYPRFSADGRWLAFRQNYLLGVWDTATETQTLLDSETRNNNPSIWSPIGFTGEEQCD